MSRDVTLLVHDMKYASKTSADIAHHQQCRNVHRTSHLLMQCFKHSCLRSSSRGDLIIPCCQLSCYSSHSFAVCGPAAWNYLPARSIFIINLFLQPSQNWTI